MAYEFHFNALAPHQRERLSACFINEMPPLPILEEKLGKTGFIIGMGVLSAVGLIALLIIMSMDFGHGWSGIQDGWWVIGYAIAMFMLVYGVVKGIQRWVLLKSLPFEPGRYVFPLDFVDATSSTIKVYPMAELADFRCVHHYNNGSYTHSELTFVFDDLTQTFNISGQQLAEELIASLDEKRQLFLHALEAGEMEIVAALDVFLEVRVNEEGWDKLCAQTEAPEEPEGTEFLANDLPYPLMLPSVVALIVGVGLATPIWGARNYMSDGAMFEKAKVGSLSQMQNYVWQGKRHVDVMKKEILPAKEFEVAKADNSVDSMREFRFHHPGSKYDDQAVEHITMLYKKAIEDFAAQANKNNPQLVPFMTHLIEYMQGHNSPPIEVRFRPPPTAPLGVMYEIMAKDFGASAPAELVAKDPVYGRELASPLPSFTDAKSSPREKKIVEILQNGFSGVFPQDILFLEEGHRLAPKPLPEAPKEGEEPAPAPEEPKMKYAHPTIVVDYVLLLSGQIYTLDNDPTRVFTGIKVLFDVEMHIPDSDEVLAMQLDVEPPQTFNVGADIYGFAAGSTSSTPSTSNVYDVMAIKAFERLVDQIRDFYFEPNTPAWKSFKPKPPQRNDIYIPPIDFSTF